ncbi:MAG: shikimate kinase, partial [Acidimicrobiales bacterium]
VLDPDNRRRIRSAGTVVWLSAAPAVLALRAAGGEHRPLLDTDPVAALTRMDGERRAIYAGLADVVVDVGVLAPEEAVEAILGELG